MIATFPSSLVVNYPPANAGDMVLIPEWGRSPREGNGNPLQYSGWENSMDGGSWWAAAYRVTEESDTT